MQKQIKTYKPIQPVIQEYVEYYYETIFENEEYYAFPHYNLPVGILNTTEIITTNDGILFSESLENSCQVITINKFIKPLKITVKGIVKEFCIVFKPHGLVHFLREALVLQTSNDFELLYLFGDLKSQIPNFCSIDVSEKIHLLELYLLRKFIKQPESDFVKRILSSMVLNPQLSIKDIAVLNKCHYKKMYRNFNKVCGASPIVFRKILRFRYALEQIKSNDSGFNMAQIAVNTNYYDQPYFNNAFKELTGLTPKSFFAQTQVYTTEDIYFRTID